jgi:hypothetical protein
VLLNTRVEKLANEKHSNLSVQFVRYIEKEVLRIGSLYYKKFS